MKRKYDVELSVAVRVEVDDEKLGEETGLNAIDQALAEDWRANYYTLDRDEVLGALAWMVGLHGRRIENVDGWANMPSDSVDGFVLTYYTDAVREVRDE